MNKYILLVTAFACVCSCKNETKLEIASENTVQENVPQPTVTEMAEGVYSIGDGFHSLVVITNDGVVVVDPARDSHAKLMMEEIKKITDQPVKYLFYTHNHWDHTKGGQIFKEQGATVICHKEAFEWLEAHPHKDLVQPDQYWSGRDTTFVIGGKSIDLHYYGINHGMGMTVFRLPVEKIAYIADIVIPHRVIYTIVPDFTPTEWIRTLKEVEKLDISKALFSHGAGDTYLGGMQQITEVREFLEDLRAAVKVQFDKGIGTTEIAQHIDLPKYKHWGNYDDWIEMNVMRMALDLHFGPYPWRKIE